MAVLSEVSWLKTTWTLLEKSLANDVTNLSVVFSRTPSLFTFVYNSEFSWRNEVHRYLMDTRVVLYPLLDIVIWFPLCLDFDVESSFVLIED